MKKNEISELLFFYLLTMKKCMTKAQEARMEQMMEGRKEGKVGGTILGSQIEEYGGEGMVEIF